MENIGKLNAAIYRNLQSILHLKLGRLDIGPGQYPFLFQIADHEGLSQKELTERMFVEKSTTAKAVKILESNGYIKRSRSGPDRRVDSLRLTAKGISHAPMVQSAYLANQALAASALDGRELETLLQLLAKVLARVSAEKKRLYAEQDAGQRKRSNHPHE